MRPDSRGIIRASERCKRNYHNSKSHPGMSCLISLSCLVWSYRVIGLRRILYA